MWAPARQVDEYPIFVMAADPSSGPLKKKYKTSAEVGEGKDELQQVLEEEDPEHEDPRIVALRRWLVETHGMRGDLLLRCRVRGTDECGGKGGKGGCRGEGSGCRPHM